MPDGDLPTDISSIIASNVRAQRARRRWYQRDLADRIGLSAASVSDLETGVRSVYATDLLLLCRALEVPLVKLLDGLSAEDLRTLGL